MVKPLIYELLLSCHKQYQIFHAFKGFSGNFNKHGYGNGSANNIWLGKQFNQILTVRQETIQPMYIYRNGSIKRVDKWFNQTICSSKLENNTRKTY